MRFTAEHEAFRASVCGVLDRSIAPHIGAWEEEGRFPAHVLFRQLAQAGLLGLEYEPRYGGQGADNVYTAIFGEELGRLHAAGVAMAVMVQTDMATPSLHMFGSEELKQQFLVPALRGDAVASIAVTEPDAGSDVAAIRTRAVRAGDEWVINGAKTFITNGTQADWICALVRTSDEGGYRGLSQVIVPTSSEGFLVSEPFSKLGNRSSDTAQLTFVDVRVPVGNTIGEIGRGFQQQMVQFQNERLIGAYGAVGSMTEALRRTADHARNRSVFGGALIDKQYVQFRLAELDAEVEVLREFVYAAATSLSAGEDVTRFATIAKLKAGRLSREVADACIQFHGGLGYMEDTWTARYFRDARLVSIGGGADEVMLRVLAKSAG